MNASSRFGIAAVCVLAHASAASAADLKGYNTALEDSRPALWQGLYGGITLGGNSTIIDVNKVGSDRDLKTQNASVGVLAGYNFTNGPWVWGGEIDLQGHGFDKKKSTAVAGLGNVSANSGALGSLRLRGGYAWNNMLLYGTAGLALTNIEAKSSLGGKADFKAGLVLGLGAEYAFDKAWIGRVEALAYGFGQDATLAGTKRDIGLGTSSVRAAIIRRF
jgi:outer membrane immunogenic protein